MNMPSVIAFRGGHFQRTAVWRVVALVGALSACLTIFAGTGEPPKRADQGPLSAPVFIDENNVWVNDADQLEILFPDPNSDGWDPLGASVLTYHVELRRDCVSFYETSVSGRRYPLWVTLSDVDLIYDDYQVVISRQDGLGKDTSPGTVILGPPGGAVFANIPDEFIEFDRWILHAPKVAGGFSGMMVFDNLFPELPVKIWVSGFDASGNLVPNSQISVIVVGQRASIPLYDAGTSSQSLYPPSLTDQISHLALFEENGRNLARASVTYQYLDEDALAATLQEVRLDQGSTVGTAFAVEARKSSNFWDGVAILNLTGYVATDVRISQRSLSDGSEIDSASLGTVPPGAKVLAVISGLFSFEPDTYYEINSTQSNARFQVMGLRGSSTHGVPLLVGSKVFKTR